MIALGKQSQQVNLNGGGSSPGSEAPTSRKAGVVYSYSESGWVKRSTHNSEGLLQGEERLYGEAGDPFFALPREAAASLERNDLSFELRQAFALNGIELFDDAQVETADPGREYLVAQSERSYTARFTGDKLEVFPGRLVRRSTYENGVLSSINRYKGGKLDGESAIYGPPEAELFSLGLEFQPALEAGAVKMLQSAFGKHDQPLAGDAVITPEEEHVEWRITQFGRMLTVRRVWNALAVFPGRLSWRAVFTEGWPTEAANYREGLLDGDFTTFGPLTAELFRLPRTLRDDLNSGRTGALLPLFEQYGHPLSDEVAVVTVNKDLEWFIKQAGQTYTLRRVADYLGVFAGRVVGQTGYKGGQPEGTSTLYDDKGVTARVITFHDGRLDGPMTLYEEDLPKALFTFRNGNKHGQTISYDDQARPALVCYYQEGLLDGELSVYKRGNRQAAASYRGDKQEGIATVYYPSGQENMVAQYKAGLREGESLIYGEDGQLVQKADYKADLLDGESLLYDPEGHLVRRVLYQQGKLDGESIDYFGSGAVRKWARLLRGKFDGAVRKRAHYREGKRDGVVAVYKESGRLKERHFYRNGQLIR